jgi:hypothetical protein
MSGLEGAPTGGPQVMIEIEVELEGEVLEC